MTDNAKSAANPKGTLSMGILIVLGIFVLWFVLQMWVLPKFGVQT